ncbi:hypothetical protein RJ639_008493 [Escallonia herrerae]|uniref:AMP-activated protein kinase glycogen-binding domain-containing protein n=1 Tax=Escallonia herrerae TaxID=1293975 RepID=A0AA88VUD9_9ASTE|nr:hypothetical protein RJ639_008493 [Escallonia herrerae]
MSSLQASNYVVAKQSPRYRPFVSAEKLGKASIPSSFWGEDLCLTNGGCAEKRRRFSRGVSRVFAMSPSTFKMNLNEYMVTLERPLGIRFALSVDGKVFVHALKKGGNAEKSRIIMVGDTLKKASESSGGDLIEIKDFGDTEKMTIEKSGSCSLIFERPFSPFQVQQLQLMTDLDIMYNRGRVPFATWNKTILTSNLQTSSEGSGNSGFVMFSSKFLTQEGWTYLNGQNKQVRTQMQKNTPVEPFSQLVTIFSKEESGDTEWAHGSFPLEEYIKALDRSKGELYYNHSAGMHYSKFPVPSLGKYGVNKSDQMLLEFTKSGIEAENWGIDTKLINESCQRFNVLMINYPIRPAIAWATWDLIAMVENGKHDGPATHAVTFVWIGHEGEEVSLVGDFTGNWKEPIKTTHKGGPQYEAEVRLSHGKYYYKFVVNGQWRHSTASPTERDERGNLNNVIVVGDKARCKCSKVIERPLTENERFMLAKAARCVAFSVCPIRLAPK